jgi:hypothetical protein
MNPHPYDTSGVISRVVPPNFLIPFESNRYWVPWTLVGLTLTVKANDQCIEFYYQERQVAVHPRSYDKHRVFENREHFKELLERKPGVTKESWRSTLSRLKHIGSEEISLFG